MQKNWYVIYTRPQSEKKVASLLTKKKFENFIPMFCLDVQKSWRQKIVNRPLFKSYVFVHVTEQEIMLLKNTEGVISLLHWLGKPAVITEMEINSIKLFISDHQDIKLEKLTVSSNVADLNSFQTSYEIDGNVVAIKHKTIKVNLPSLGYAMIANLKDNSIFGREGVVQNYIFAKS